MLLPLEPALLERLYARDPTAMVDFYDRYGPALYGLLRRLLRDEQLAEDILQEGLVKIWHLFPTYQAAKGSVFTWALTLCRNLALDELRSRRAQQARHTQPLEGCGAIAAAPTSFAPEHVGLRELVAQLPPAQRQVLELLYFHGYTHAEAAEQLGLPLGTVGTHARAALRALRQVAGIDKKA